MKFTVSSNQLLKELNILSGTISTNSVLPILEDFLFQLEGNHLKLFASDLETSMSSQIEVKGSEDGEVAIPSRILLETLKALPDQPIDFDINNDLHTISINASSGNYNLSGESGEDFPSIPKAQNTTDVSVKAAILLKAINKTLFAISTDELRPAMNGVNIELGEAGTTFVATDGYKLVKYKNTEFKSKELNSFIVPRKSLVVLKNALMREEGEVKISYNQANAFFSLDRVQLVCRLIDSKFPDYNAVIPTNNPNTLSINRQDLAKALKRIAIYSNQTTYQVKLVIGTSLLNLVAEDIDFSNEAKESLSCDYNGDKMAIAFNARYLAEALNVVDTEQVMLELSTSNRAGVLLPAEKVEGEELLLLVLPLMMN